MRAALVVCLLAAAACKSTPQPEPQPDPQPEAAPPPTAQGEGEGEGGPGPAPPEIACPEADAPVATGAVADDRIEEASGIAASRRHPDVYWLHNDSGDDAIVYAVGADGRLRGALTLEGVDAVDWEDLAIGPLGPDDPTPHLWLGDTGDNRARKGEPGARDSVTVYRLPEPAALTPEATIRPEGWEAIELTYADGPQDVEAVMVDPRTGDLWLVSKSNQGLSGVYRAAGPVRSGGRHTLERLQTLDVNALGGAHHVTASDIAPSGGAIALRTYDSIHWFHRPPAGHVGQALAGPSTRIAAPVEQQGEALAFAADGAALITVSEGDAQPLYRIALGPGCRP